MYPSILHNSLQYYPAVHLVTANGSKLETVGSAADPWRITATIVTGTGPVGAAVLGTATAPVIAGSANFTELVLSMEGIGYQVSTPLPTVFDCTENFPSSPSP